MQALKADLFCQGIELTEFGQSVAARVQISYACPNGPDSNRSKAKLHDDCGKLFLFAHLRTVFYYSPPKTEGYRFSVVRPAVCPSGRHKFVGAISQRLLQI